MLLKKSFLFSAVLVLLVFVGQASAGPNANATVSLDLIADGGAGNQRDDGVTSGTVSGQGTKIAVEVFAKDVTTSLIGMKIEFNYDASVLTYVKAENSAFAFIIPDDIGTGVNLAAVAPVTLPASGFLARAEFTTVADVTGREFSIGIRRVIFAESASSSDVITATAVIKFNAAPSPDFDGDGMVGIPDFLLFVDVFGSSQGDGKYEAKYDLDGNGVIEIPDFLIFVDNFGKKITSSGDGGGEQIVDIPDANLRAVIADSLGKSSGATITQADMLTLTTLLAPNANISDLTGLEYATNLTSLNLYFNQRISDISALSGLSNLRTLILTATSISDFSVLSGLTNLEYLYLTGTNISDLSVLSGLTNLEYLYLAGTNISDLSVLSGLSNLRTLILTATSISDFSVLPGLTNLRSLDLGHTSILDISVLSNLTSLERLYLNHTSISDISVLSNLTSLERLYLNHTSISDISVLSNLTNLKTLNLEITGISDISVLSNLTSLEWLDLSATSISDISVLSGLTSLEWLELPGNNISDFSVLSNLTNLTHLGLHRTGIDISVLSNLTSLERLNLGSNSISDISSLSNLTRLTYLGLHNNSITDISSLSGLTSLEYLRLDKNSISDLAPLVSNTGLGSGDKVNVRNNPLSDTSLNTHIPALQGRGVEVQFGASKPAVGEIERRLPHEAMKRFGHAEWEKEGDLFGQ